MTVTLRPDTHQVTPPRPTGPGSVPGGRPVRPLGLRRRVAAGIAATAAVLAGVALVDTNDGRVDVRSTRPVVDPPSPAHRAAPATTVPAAVAPDAPGTAVPSTTTAPPRPFAAPPAAAGAPPAAAGAPACRNSSDPVCGAFRWDPAPAADRPLTVALQVVPTEPVAGEEVTVRVVAVDPDAPVTTNGGTVFWDDPHDTGVQIGFPSTVERAPERFGPWTPPAPEPGRLETSFTHTFSRPGTFRFTFAARSGDASDPGNRERHPYAGAGEASVTITVTAAPEGGAAHS